jgi:hypothetical protein
MHWAAQGIEQERENSKYGLGDKILYVIIYIYTFTKNVSTNKIGVQKLDI